MRNYEIMFIVNPNVAEDEIDKINTQVEGIITTMNADNSVNISPMGPRVDASLTTFVLRPYQTSTTYKNIKRTGAAVFHVTDDVDLAADAFAAPLTSPSTTAAWSRSMARRAPSTPTGTSAPRFVNFPGASIRPSASFIL